MATIVNKEGRLYSKVGRLDYELINGIPPLKYSYIIDSTIAITSDQSTLYDVLNEIELVEVGSGYVSVIELSIDRRGVRRVDNEIVRVEFISRFYALRDNGDLLLFTYDSRMGSLHYVNVAANVRFFSVYNDHLYYINDHSWIKMRSDGLTKQLLLLNHVTEPVLGVTEACVITASSIHIWSANDRIIKYVIEGVLISVAMYIESNCDIDENMVLIMENVGGKLKVTICNPIRLSIPYGCKQFSNEIVDEIHSINPFYEIVQLNNKLYLLNAEGRLIMLTRPNMISTPNIPRHIMSIM